MDPGAGAAVEVEPGAATAGAAEEVMAGAAVDAVGVAAGAADVEAVEVTGVTVAVTIVEDEDVGLDASALMTSKAEMVVVRSGSIRALRLIVCWA